MARKRFRDESHAIYTGAQLCTKDVGDGRWYALGFVSTHDGVVGVHAQNRYTRLRMIVRGRVYERSYDRTFSDRGLAQVAALFARFVAEEA